MRFPFRRVVTAALLAGGFVTWSGCEAKQQTEYVTGISTQVRVPRDLKTVQLSVSAGGVRIFCRGYRVYDGKVLLPRSLGNFAENDPGQIGPVTYTVIGYTTRLEEGEEFNELRCNDTVSNNDARILRRSRQPFIKDEILFLPMPLKYSCFDVACEGEDKTCKGGRCVDATIDPATLPRYSPDLVDGTGGACFRVAECLGAAGPAQVVDAATCTYAVPNTPSAPELPIEHPVPALGEGVNVEIVWDGGLNREVLDKDAEEGFTIPDPTKPQQFRLAPGLCDMVHGFTLDGDGNETPTAHRISAVRTSGLCRAKTPTQPICAGDQLALMDLDENGVSPAPDAPDACKPTELRPPSAALMLVVDDTERHRSFFDPEDIGAVQLSLEDPAFRRTDVGLVYAPGGGQCAAEGSFLPAVAPKRARLTKDVMLTNFVDHAAQLQNVEAVDFAGALRDTYALLQGPAYDDYFRRAVLVIGNRDFARDCGGSTPAALAAAASASPKRVDTYVIALARDSAAPEAPLEAAAFDLAEKGGTGAVTDARASKAPAKEQFQRIVERLATCVYDIEPGQREPEDGDVLSYYDPAFGTPVRTIAHDAACNGEAASANGWGKDPGNPRRIYVCGQACTDYRGVLATASNFAAAQLKPSPSVPIFAHRKGCEPTK